MNLENDQTNSNSSRSLTEKNSNLKDQHMNPTNTNSTNHNPDRMEYWRSLDELQGRPELAERYEKEFISTPLSQNDSSDGFARRDFLKLMGASMAMATTACVRRPQTHIIPYAKAPKEVTPGEANYYTSSWFDGHEGAGIIVKTHEGRPIKIEGNPAHPLNKGGLSARAHAEVLALYDPDRLRNPVLNVFNKERTSKESVSTQLDAADEKITAALKKGGVALLTGSMPSPSTKAMIAEFNKHFSAKWVQYDPLPLDAVREGQKKSYGKGILPRLRVDRANLIVTIDTDLLGTYLSPVEYTKMWSSRKSPGKSMNRLVAFESIVSLTGMNADDRYRIRPSKQLDLALNLIDRVSKTGGGFTVPSGVQAAVKAAAGRMADLGVSEEVLKHVATELVANKGESLVVAGGSSTLTKDQVDLQIAVNALNSMLGNDGKTIDHDGATYESYSGSVAALEQLISEMKSGKIKTLIMDGTNFAYVLPAASGFVEALRKVETVISTANRIDETAKHAHWVLPAGSSLESWGDLELQTGVWSIQQPTIMPLYGTRSFPELLLGLLQKAGSSKDVASYLEFVKKTWKGASSRFESAKGKAFDDFWYDVLQTGVAVTSGHDRSGSARAFVGSLSAKEPSKNQGLELVLYPSVQLLDGKYANVAWLQEVPDPISKVVWDNYLALSPETAKKLGLKQEDVVQVSVGDRSIQAPVLVQPGLADDTAAIALGYGRTAAGKVGNIGVDANPLSGWESSQLVLSGLNVSVKKTGARYQLVSTQEHHMMENRPIVLETTKAAYENDPSSGIHKHNIFSIWPQHQYTKHKWGLSIDLNTCTGCSACVIACQSENNVPVVGKKYVYEGREMHWIRIDRYYKGDVSNPEFAMMPLTCQQCENAPCETVCPVLATVHNDEGLNDMSYNRCVGTRYCANNCPYKVRRFNWFNWTKKREEPLHMSYNPDVTVRMRGVMEKCTFCVQRIRKGTNFARDEKRELRDGEIKTACQESCPADAIVFGDLNNPQSKIAKLFADPRTYKLLEDLNAVPRVGFMTRVRNAQRESAKADSGHHAAGESTQKKTNEAVNNTTEGARV